MGDCFSEIKFTSNTGEAMKTLAGYLQLFSERPQSRHKGLAG